MISVWYVEVAEGQKLDFLSYEKERLEEHGFMKAKSKTLNFKCFSQLSALQIWKSESQGIIII